MSLPLPVGCGDNLLTILKKNMPWADRIDIRRGEFFGWDIRVKKGDWAKVVKIEEIDHPGIIDCICDNITHEFRDAMGQAILDNKIQLVNHNVAVPVEKIIEVEVPTLGDYIIQKAKDIGESIVAPFIPRKKEKPVSTLPSKIQPNKKMPDMDSYYKMDDDKKWWQLWK